MELRINFGQMEGLWTGHLEKLEGRGLFLNQKGFLVPFDQRGPLKKLLFLKRAGKNSHGPGKGRASNRIFN